MNYIINPMWFYWINVADAISFAVSVAAGLLVFTEIAMAIIALVSYSDGQGFDEDDPDLRRAKLMIKPIIICGVALAVCMIAIIFIPSKNTLIEMQVARFATYENAEWTVETVKSAVDYIINAIQTVNGG